MWILHFAYAWIVLALALHALAAYALVPASLATHALTVGAIGGLTLGMMTRTSLGHTGRPLQTGSSELFCYIAIQLAALARVFVPLAFPSLSTARHRRLRHFVVARIRRVHRQLLADIVAAAAGR